MTRIFRLLPLVLPCLCAPSAALADAEGTLNLYVNGGYQWFSSNRLNGTPLEDYDLGDSWGGGAGFDFNITDRWALGGAVDQFNTDVGGIDENVDVLNYHVDLLYQFAGQFCGNYCWQPYVAFGAGEIRVDFDHRDPDLNWHQRQTMVNLGLGIKYRLGPRWQARADARLFQGVEEGGLDGVVGLSIGYQWTEYPVVLRDLDGDGVYEDVDECPQTPPGVSVGPKGCPIDSDFDGVPDYLDQCPGTPPVTAVEENGCRS